MNTLIRSNLNSGLILGFTLCACIGWTGLLHAAEHPGLSLSPSMDFQTVFDAALEIAPDALASNARVQQADAYQAIADSWFTGRPSWQFNYIDDGMIDDNGLTELESGVQLNLWRPGEKREAQRLGQRYGEQAESWLSYLHLQVAGQVRSSLASLASAEALLVLEQQATADAERLLAITNSLFNSGEVAQLDVLQAESLLLEQRRIELQAEAELVDAEREYSALTGLSVRPSNAHSETLSSTSEIPNNHPVLSYMQSGIDLAESNIELVKRQSNGNPTMTLGVRRERGNRLTPYNDSFGISFSVPFGKSASANASVSHARSNRVDAEILLLNTRKTLNAQLSETEHELFLTEESLKFNEAQLDINDRRYAMALIAFESGETNLSQVVIALQQANESRQEQESLRLKMERLTTEYNQIIGILP